MSSPALLETVPPVVCPGCGHRHERPRRLLVGNNALTTGNFQMTCQGCGEPLAVFVDVTATLHPKLAVPVVDTRDPALQTRQGE